MNLRSRRRGVIATIPQVLAAAGDRKTSLRALQTSWTTYGSTHHVNMTAHCQDQGFESLVQH